MADNATSQIDTFKKIFLRELELLEERRMTDPPKPGPTRDEIVERTETNLGKVGLQPWQLCLPILADTGENPRFRSTAVNLLHIPARVPEDVAPKIADAAVAIMREQNLDYRLGQQTVMAASILRRYDPATPMLPISIDDIDRYFFSFAMQIPTPVQGQSQSEATLGHVAHMLASMTRFTVVYNHGYDNLLTHRLADFFEAQAEFKGELEREGKLYELRRGLPRGFYAIVHPMEHLAELMEEGTKTRDRSLVELLIRGGVANTFASLLEQRAVLGIAGGDIPKYLRQRDGFSAVANEMGIYIIL